jgi:hypothetical protein
MATLTVGSGLQYKTIAQAVAASHDNDVIQVHAGTYRNDFVQLNDSITLESVGGMATILATVPPNNLKGIITVGDGSHAPNVTIDGFVLAGATISAAQGNNAAGVRYQSGNLTLSNDIIRDNQDGLLATPYVANSGSIIVNRSTFAANGAGDGRSHNIYVNQVRQFTFEDSVSTGAIVGHDIKSRALNTTILNSTISDGATGTGSYEIDLPNGGNVLIQGNTIQQGPDSQNPVIISYGEEGAILPGSALKVAGNTILNDLHSHIPTAVRNVTTVAASVSGNRYYGLTPAQLTAGTAVVSNNTSLAVEPVIGSGGGSVVAVGGAVPGPFTVNQNNTFTHTGSAHVSVLVAGAHDTIYAGTDGASLVATGGGTTVITAAGASDTIDMRNSGRVTSAGTDDITTGASAVSVTASGHDTIHAAAGQVNLTGLAGSASSVTGGAGRFEYSGHGGALDYTGGSGSAYIAAGSGGATVTFGSGATNVFAGSGAERLVFVNGKGGTDHIPGFDPKLDTLVFQGFSGSAVKAHTYSGGSTLLRLTDGTSIAFLHTPSIVVA